jgi:hypothetical protein
MEHNPGGGVGSALFSNVVIDMARATKRKSSSKGRRKGTMAKGSAKRASSSRAKSRAKSAKPRKAKKGALSKLLSSLPLVS